MNRRIALWLFNLGCWLERVGTPRSERSAKRGQQNLDRELLDLCWRTMKRNKKDKR